VKTLVILSVSAGAGHVRCADALRATAEARFGPINAIHVDVMQWVPKLFKKYYADSYIKLVERHPALWGYLYHRTDQQAPDSKAARLQAAFERINTRKFEANLQALDPDIVLCTHFLPPQLLARMIEKESFDKPVWVQVTDYDIHQLWIHPQMAGYCAGNEEVAFRMADRGVPADRIHVTGIPIMPAFSSPLSRTVCAKEAGLDPTKTTALIMAGGAGLGGMEALVERLVNLRGDFQLIALAGRNEAMLASLRALAARHPGKLFAQGFTTTIERLMACADLAITKPGGLSTSECLAMGLPMILVSPIPGQEERNADYLLESGAAWKAFDAAGLEFRMRALFENPAQLAQLREQSLRIARPHAARAVLELVLR
jgi:processive 1,2-diacylglycerol beta-glucosyltransferase